jgi:hypothetical protein
VKSSSDRGARGRRASRSAILLRTPPPTPPIMATQSPTPARGRPVPGSTSTTARMPAYEISGHYL